MVVDAHAYVVRGDLFGAAFHELSLAFQQFVFLTFATCGQNKEYSQHEKSHAADHFSTIDAPMAMPMNMPMNCGPIDQKSLVLMIEPIPPVVKKPSGRA